MAKISYVSLSGDGLELRNGLHKFLSQYNFTSVQTNKLHQQYNRKIYLFILFVLQFSQMRLVNRI